MSERSWQRCPPSWRGTDPAFGALKKHFGAAQEPLHRRTAFLARDARTPASWVRLASAYDLERWATDDLPAVPMPHGIALRSLYLPGQPTSASGIAKVAQAQTNGLDSAVL